MAVTGSIVLNVNLTETKTGDFADAAFAVSKSYQWAIANGTAASQCDLEFNDQRTLSAGANEDLDLAAGLTSIYGASLTYVKLKLFILYAATANPNAISLSRPAANGVPLFLATSDGITIPPGCAFAWFSPTTGVTITAGTGDLINVLAGAGGNHVYDVFIAGTSA